MEYSLEELTKEITEYEACILYQPFKNEADYTTAPLQLPNEQIILPSSKDADPFLWAERCIKKLKNKKTIILLPGSAFDKEGTRHGRGGGWYDRFLSKIPEEWLRIGVAHSSEISKDALLRKEWDEAVDWILARDGVSWNVYRASSKRGA